MYLIILSIGIIVSYFLCIAILNLVFNKKLEINYSRGMSSILIILVFTWLTYFISVYLFHGEISNRLLHMFGGGFNVTLVVFLAQRDSKISIGYLQFAIMSILLVSFFGICNEILEYLMQEFFRYTFARSIEDTWLDLISNLIGSVIGVVSLAYFFKYKKIEK